jgi:uncharacterized protein YkwD
MHVAPLRLLLVLLLLLSVELSTVRAQALSEPSAVLSPVLYLPLVGSGGATTAATPDGFVQRVVALTNQMRAEAGCPALHLSPALTEAALTHSRDMAANDFFDHIGSDGSTSWQRIERMGYRPTTSAENIAVGFATPESVMTAWRNSSGHRQNILNCALTEIGVGYVYDETGQYRHYWTQDFARQ